MNDRSGEAQLRCVVTYHELGLKGRNRSRFERQLQKNLAQALQGMPTGAVERIASRLSVRVLDPDAANLVARTMAVVPGVHAVSITMRVDQDIDAMVDAAEGLIAQVGPIRSFRVTAQRSSTQFPLGSQEINRLVGARLAASTGARVDLTRHDVNVQITVVQGDAYVGVERIEGAGGLPVGTAGRVVSLLSSGIDSPVATWRMIRRGATVVGVHFSGRPQISAASERIVTELGEALSVTGGLARIHIVPFGDIQKEIALSCPPDLRVLLYRRMMIRVAERIARVERARALVTGESLGQVASQTLANIAAVDDVATLPVLRPLIGNDKLEIIAEARRINTYELSIQDAEDCCTLFMPRNPETQAKIPLVRAAWDALDHERMVEDALTSLEWVDFRCADYRPPREWPTPSGERGWNAAAAAGPRTH